MCIKNPKVTSDNFLKGIYDDSIEKTKLSKNVQLTQVKTEKRRNKDGTNRK